MSGSTLRGALYAVGGLLVAGGAVLALAGCRTAAAWVAGWGLVLIIGLLFERWRYKPLTGARLGPGWVATDERFVDPETGKLVTVYFHAATGERRYVAAPDIAG
jgi:hypothetical protein